jgi:hypothetical protein
MKISEIKSEEVRNEAVRLAKLHHKNSYQIYLRKNEVDELGLFWAFPDSATEYPEFWKDLRKGTTPNTPNLKLPICNN